VNLTRALGGARGFRDVNRIFDKQFSIDQEGTMHFPNLTEIGDNYASEEGTEGVRQIVLDSVATKYRKALMDLEAARAEVKAARVAPRGALVAVRRAFFEGGAGLQEQAQAELDVKAAEFEVEYQRSKLTRQGAVLKPDGAIDWTLTSRTVIYDHTAQAQGLTKLHPFNGLLYADADHRVQFDSVNLVTQFGGKGWAIYVMSEQGNIHVSAHSVGHRHHSSLLAGADVSGAGEIKVLGGRLTHISNKSGHYGPGAAHLVQVLYLLQKRGVNLSQTQVTFMSANGTDPPYPNVQAFLNSLPGKGVEPDFEYVKMIAYARSVPYGQLNRNLSANGWQWSPRGVVTIAGTQVPHRDVRKYLKGLGYTMRQTVQSGSSR
jgi:hypothetical protein